MRGRLALAAVLAALAVSAEAGTERRERRRAEVRQVTREANALQQARPQTDPANVRFYDGSPAVAGWVLHLCTRPGPKPRRASCEAAAEARRYDR